jgi:primosomal protein N' (replication factor Y)
VLNPQQQAAVQAIADTKSGTLLLHGVTGAGKTHVYIEAANHQQALGKSSIVLVPEISLTPQLVAEFAHHFSTIIVTHSHMTEAERHIAWLAALQANEPVIVIGPRSALFIPLANLGLIVIDECHEPSFKQEQAPRYSALRVASKLANLSGAKVVLGSATPAVSDYYLAHVTQSPIIELPNPAIETTPPRIVTIDLKNRDNFREHRFLSDELLAAMRDAVAEKKQVLLFHNRRGTSPTALCAQCGWTAECPACFVPLTLHADKHQLLCHLCGRNLPVPPNCPICHFPDITFRGIGTKLIEDTLKRLFPRAVIARFDADNATNETLAARYQELYDGNIDIIIGTQLLAKGLDLPNLRVVGVVQADTGLQLPDYQAEERVFQLLYQVVGRVGRNHHTSTVVIQAYQVDNPIIQLALERNYAKLYEQQLVERRRAQFPPFVYLLKLMCVYKTEAGAIRAAQKMAQVIREGWPHCIVLGPAPAFYEHLGGTYRWQLLVKAKRRADLVAIVQAVPAGWQTDLDPVSLL